MQVQLYQHNVQVNKQDFDISDQMYTLRDKCTTKAITLYISVE